MHVTTFYPLRTVVGAALPVQAIHVLNQSPASRALKFKYVVMRRTGVAETVNEELYAEFLTRYRITGRNLVPAGGVATLPVHPHLPFGDGEPLCSVFGLSDTTVPDADQSRELSVTLRIRLTKPGLIGGICFAGYPYLPARIDGRGETESNFGLPREVRLTCVPFGPGSGGFIDAESSYSDQQVSSHGAFHYVRTDPVLARELTLYLSDYPLLLRRVLIEDPRSEPVLQKRFALVIPYLYVFAYEEGTRYRSVVPVGLFGVTSPIPEKPKTFPQAAAFMLPEFELLGEPDGDRIEYAPFTPGSALGPRRKFAFENPPLIDGKVRGYVESFISDPVEPGQRVVLFLEQSEEYERCIAGLKILLPFIPEVNLAEEIAKVFPEWDGDMASVPRATLEKALRYFLGIPQSVNFCEAVGLRVYELDPPEGVSPAALDRTGKYATLLAEREIDELSEIALAHLFEGVRFVRPSNARYFAVELENRDEQPGQFVVASLNLIQSASVSVHPRAAKTQRIQAIHFRLVGADLADDYAGLGEGGFNFSVERLVAGQTKSVLFRARSLLDLLHLGVARVYGNGRRRGIEFETAEVVTGRPNFERRRSSARLAGWRRSEMGSDLPSMNAWTNEEIGLDNENNKFESFAAGETRTHTLMLYPHIANEWNAARGYFNLISAIATVGSRTNPVPNHNGRLNSPWRNSRWNAALTFDQVRGLRAVNISPFSAITNLEEFFTRVNEADPSAVSNLVTALASVPALVLSAGSNTAISASPGGIGMTLGISPYPSLLYTNTHGSTGSITRSASEAIYSYAQSLNHGAEESSHDTTIAEGVSNRRITRAAVEGTDRQRVKGAEIMWQGRLVDIVAGSVPMNVVLPATAGKMYRTSDEAVRVRLGNGAGATVSVDVWFDLIEEAVKDDY